MSVTPEQATAHAAAYAKARADRDGALVADRPRYVAPPPPPPATPKEIAEQSLAQARGDLRRAMITRVRALHEQAAKEYFLQAQKLVELTLTLLAHDHLCRRWGDRKSTRLNS